MTAYDLERGLRAIRSEHAHAFALENLLQRGQVAGFVIDHEHGDIRATVRRRPRAWRQVVGGLCHRVRHHDTLSAPGNYVNHAFTLTVSMAYAFGTLSM